MHFLVVQGSLQEQEDSESDSSLSQSPSVQDWLAQARTTRSQQHQDSLQRQKVHLTFFLLSCFSAQFSSQHTGLHQVTYTKSELFFFK